MDKAIVSITSDTKTYSYIYQDDEGVVSTGVGHCGKNGEIENDYITNIYSLNGSLIWTSEGTELSSNG